MHGTSTIKGVLMIRKLMMSVVVLGSISGCSERTEWVDVKNVDGVVASYLNSPNKHETFGDLVRSIGKKCLSDN